MKVISLKCSRCGQNGLVNSYEGVVCVTCGYHPNSRKSEPMTDPRILEFFGLDERPTGIMFTQSKS